MKINLIALILAIWPAAKKAIRAVGKGSPGGRAGIAVALLCEEATQIQAAQGRALDGDQLCALLQDMSALVVDYVLPKDVEPPRIMIASIEA